MSSIPYPILVSQDTNIIQPEEIQEHQKFSQSFYKLYQLYEKRNENNITENEFRKQNKEKILNWFENLSTNQRIKICTIKNQWLVNIFIQLYLINQSIDTCVFKPINDMKIFFNEQENSDPSFHSLNNFLSFKNKEEDYEQNNCKNNNDYIGYVDDLNFYENFFSLPNQDNDYNYNYFSKEENKRRDVEKNFIDKIKITSLGKNNINNTLTLSKDILENCEKIKFFLNYFSEQNYFNDWLLPIKMNNHYYNFILPKWMHRKNLSLCKIIIGYIEQQIILSYEYYFYSKKIFEYSYQNQIISLYEENNKLTSFVYENYSYWEHSDPNKEELVSLLRIKEIVDGLKKKPEKLNNFNEVRNKIFSQLYENWQGPKIYEKEFYTDIYQYLQNELINEKEFGVIKIIDHITFYKFNDIIELKDNIFALMRQRIIQKQCDQVLNELVSEDFLNSKNNNNKKNKNKNKNKKKKKKSGKNIEDEINNKENKISKECEEKKVNEENLNDIKNDKKMEDDKSNKINILTKIETKNINEKIINKDNENNKINNNENNINENDKNIINNKNDINQEEIKSTVLTNIENNNISPSAKSKNKTKDFFLYPIINTNSKNSKKKKNICSLSESKQKEIAKEDNEKVEDKKETITPKESLTNKSSNQKYNMHKNQVLTIQNEHLNFYQTEQKIKSSSFTQIKNDNNFNYMIVPFFQFLTPNYTPSEKYFELLSKEISNYIKITNYNISKINPLRLKHLIEVENLIKTGLCENYEIKFGHYGSYFTDLSIEGSDIDILIFFKSKNTLNDINNFYNDILLLLTENEDKFELITPILTASVPIIKLQIDITNEMNDLNLSNLFYLDKENELNKIKIDLSFTQNEQNYNHSYEIVSYIIQSLNNFNLIKSLLLVLKRYFKVMKMNKSYTGGLSSYSLYLLIYTFIKNIPNYSLGKSLYFFLTRFSYFDFKNYGIDSEKNIFVINSNDIDKKDEIIIIDPLTKLNVAKSSYKVDEIKNTFRNAFELIRNEGWLFDYAILRNKTGYDYLNNFKKSYGHYFEHDECNDYITIKKLFGLKNTNIF